MSLFPKCSECKGRPAAAADGLCWTCYERRAPKQSSSKREKGAKHNGDDYYDPRDIDANGYYSNARKATD